jgi:hypothetical protein
LRNRSATRGTPDLAFGSNIAGSVLGGLAESFSMLIGFQHLLYAFLSAVGVVAATAAGSHLIEASLRAERASPRSVK